MSDPNNTRLTVARTNYFSGESLLTADFICEQQFNMGMRALQNSSLRTYGIASGLEVTWQPGSDQVSVSAGMAIDRLGRQIVLAGRQVFKLPSQSDVLYLTVHYHETYADYSVESGVPGYKRIVQQPIIESLPTLQDPGINILLAIVNFSTTGGVDTLSFKQGLYERRYVGSRVGVVELITEGSGIHTQNGATPAELGDVPAAGIRMVALREDSGRGDYLDVQARRSQFNGMLTTRDSLGVGIDHPQATLQVQRIVIKGLGTLTTRGRLLMLQTPLYPPLLPGDVIIPELPVGASPLVPRQAVVDQAGSESGQYQIQQAFQEDLLLPCRFSYIRMTLARFTAGDLGEVFSIDGQGTVGLGVRSAVQSGTPGPAALTITSDRHVGIALSSNAGPQATLDVNGSVRTDSLTCTGTVTAQSFEGNGAKLQNLPILSYWTKQNAAATYSNIYYATGNVGVQVTNPPASLTVGTGPGFIGAGTVTADKTDSTKLVGFQTAFTSQVSYGDGIVLGRLMQQAHQIRTISSDTTLELTDQFAIILQQSAYRFRASGGSDAKPGNGTISSSGNLITGTGTKFTQDLRPGDWLVVDQFEPDSVDGYKQQWLVNEVTDDMTLTVINDEGKPIPANVSAYLVSRALMGMFRSNANIDANQAPPPSAMLLVNNGPDWAENKVSANTVGINIELQELNPKYALQVDGDVDFSGSSSFNKLSAKQLTVTEWANITGAGNDGTVLMVGSNQTTPLLSVTQANVVIGPTAGTGQGMLEIGGDAHATGNIVAAKQLQGDSASVTNAISAGSLQAGAMDVSGVKIDPSGNVTAFGTRVQINISSSAPVQSQVAQTDGFIVATLYPNGEPFSGALTCTTSPQNGGPATNYYASASSTSYISSTSDKNGTSYFTVQQQASLCVPVRNGELWRLTFTTHSGANPANVQAFWVPLGSGTSQVSAPATPAAASPTPAFDPATQFVLERQPLPTGDGTQASWLANAQREIDQRVGDLTKVLGDATRMPADQSVREDFVQRLQKIVCSATPPGTQPDNRVEPQLITDLIDTFARITKREFTSLQRALLDKGVRTLMAINDNDANRNDLNLIRNNINLFLQYLQQATDLTFDNGQRRLLTRALVRLVGNGRQDPAQVSPNAPRG